MAGAPRVEVMRRREDGAMGGRVSARLVTIAVGAYSEWFRI